VASKRRGSRFKLTSLCGAVCYEAFGISDFTRPVRCHKGLPLTKLVASARRTAMARPEALSRAALLLAACGYASGFALAPSRLSMALVSSKNSAFSRTAPEVLRRSNPRSQARHGIAGMRSMASSSLTRFMAEPELPSEEIISAVERAGGRVTVRSDSEAGPNPCSNFRAAPPPNRAGELGRFPKARPSAPGPTERGSSARVPPRPGRARGHGAQYFPKPPPPLRWRMSRAGQACRWTRRSAP